MTQASLWTLTIFGASLAFVVFAVINMLTTTRTAGEDRPSYPMMEYSRKTGAPNSPVR